jgi:hypothetical protein
MKESGRWEAGGGTVATAASGHRFRGGDPRRCTGVRDPALTPSTVSEPATMTDRPAVDAAIPRHQRAPLPLHVHAHLDGLATRHPAISNPAAVAVR